MKNEKENRLKKVKLFLIYNITNKINIGGKYKHSLTNTLLSCIRCIRISNELKECDF